jgi:hypothetical protein
MRKIKPAARVAPSLLKAGQIWRMAEANLHVGMVGRLLVHYKLGKPNAIRMASACSSIKTIEAYLKTNKAVLASA